MVCSDGGGDGCKRIEYLIYIVGFDCCDIIYDGCNDLKFVFCNCCVVECCFENVLIWNNCYFGCVMVVGYWNCYVMWWRDVCLFEGLCMGYVNVCLGFCIGVCSIVDRNLSSGGSDYYDSFEKES